MLRSLKLVRTHFTSFITQAKWPSRQSRRPWVVLYCNVQLMCSVYVAVRKLAWELAFLNENGLPESGGWQIGWASWVKSTGLLRLLRHTRQVVNQTNKERAMQKRL